ncbi:16S rRNA (cytosine(967)-C(5))-methyltransferase RsmB [Thermodesulforhabdus norvegica]|uniref:16S rRNA (cytosine(967)-C(5))-methyltransferase n=1 Tax=Thermodesulforhabdus norvegica TaxID=39841 RepID=A0A1I4SLX5_9BACT|nr:16S rRNA (cytosine(967)-C(5))-methyltransferase RsmB [Thermodesulforhabdus norvegica]SFM65417.1 16S rRNA (cytosine967-C5)-methyltransferase [Thermodesulforhabdus norvegica]
MMTPRALAYHVLLHIEQKNVHPDKLLRALLKNHPYLSPADRALITELVYGTLRWQGRLDWHVQKLSRVSFEKIKPEVRVLLRLGLYQLFFLNRIPDHAAVNETVRIARATQPRYIVSFVNGILREAARRGPDEWEWPDPEREPGKFIAVTTSHPLWFVEKLAKKFPYDEIVEICEANNRVAPLVFRFHPEKVSLETLSDWFRERSCSVEEGRYLRNALRVKGLREDLSQMEPFVKGWIQVQDEASQLVGYMVYPLAGERVLDLCCGHGVKTTQLAFLMEGKGEIVAVDSAAWKLESLEENARRLGVSIITPLVSDVRSLSADEIGLFDRVLLDAPCTGWGTVRRNPDIKWKTHPRDPWRISRLQWDLLSHASLFVQPGGTLTYATCSIFDEENLEVAVKFEKSFGWSRKIWGGNKGIRPGDLLPEVDEIVRDGYIQTFPHRHDVDGFFVITWERPKGKR